MILDVKEIFKSKSRPLGIFISPVFVERTNRLKCPVTCQFKRVPGGDRSVVDDPGVWN